MCRARHRGPHRDDRRLRRPDRDPTRDPADCLALADACGHALAADASVDRNLVAALRATLEACAVVAATDTLRDNGVPESGMLADTRRVWTSCGHGRRENRP